MFSISYQFFSWIEIDVCLQGGLDRWTLGRLPGHDTEDGPGVAVPKVQMG